MTDWGRVVDVQWQREGDQLRLAAAASATTLAIVDSADFDEKGGLILIDGDSAPVVYTGIGGTDGAPTLLLGLPHAAAVDIDTQVWLWDSSLGAITESKVAFVLPDDDPGADIIEADIDVPDLRRRLVEGPRTEGRGESVSLAFDEDDEQYKVTGVIGRNFDDPQRFVVTTGNHAVATNLDTVVDFPTPFAKTPGISLTLTGNIGNPQNFAPPVARLVTKTGFSLRTYRSTGTDPVSVVVDAAPLTA